MQSLLLRKNALLLVGIVMALMADAHAASVVKLDYSKHKVIVEGNASALVDGVGAEPYPVAYFRWESKVAPTAEKPHVVVFDYQTPVKVAALAHYFYVPGCRDHRECDWLSGPSAFDKVRIYASDDQKDWKLVSTLQGLPTACPQILKIEQPTTARYLKLEVDALAPGSGMLRSYEMDTYLDSVPASLPSSSQSKPARSGFPNKRALARVTGESAGTLTLRSDRSSFGVKLAAAGEKPLASTLEIRVNGALVLWDSVNEARGKMSGTADGNRLDMSAAFVRAGLLLEFQWKGPVAPPFQKIDVIATPDLTVSEWCIPGYELLNQAPKNEIAIATTMVQTSIAVIGDGKRSLSVIPDTDRSWIALREKSVVASFPATGEKFSTILQATSGGYFAGFQRAVVDVFDFSEPRQFSPVSQALEDNCKWLLRPEFWCDRLDTLYTFPGREEFYIFYDLPYTVSALTFWSRMSDDPVADEKIDKIIRFIRKLQFKDGPMAGAMFSEYASRDHIDKKIVPVFDVYATWKDQFANADLIGMDQSNNHRITTHTMGAVLWAIAQVWKSRGSLTDEMMECARSAADWMLRHQREDGSWPYAYNEDGNVAMEMSDSGTIWGVWGLHRFAQLTGDPNYKTAADKAVAYFRKTFIEHHLYRGYWEDNYVHEKVKLNTRQGYESTISAIAFAEMGDKQAAVSAATDSLKYVCTRELESRTYWTSYGQVSEQEWWAPASYLACPFGYAAQKAWRMTGDNFLRRFSFTPKVMGWWQEDNGKATWVGQGRTHQPIEMYQGTGGWRCYYVGWDISQKITFGMPWLIDEFNRRSGDTIAIDTQTLAGKDDHGVEVAVKVVNGRVSSASNQVNWLGMRSAKSGEYQLALINHAEATTVKIESPFKTAPTSARMFTADGKPRSSKAPAQASGKIELKIPAGSTIVLVWAKQ